MRTRALTVVAPICPEKQAELERALAVIAANLDHNPLVPFSRLATTHFARFVILPPPPASGDALLVFESNHDGEPAEYLDLLARTAGPGLDALFGCCRGWPGVADVDGYSRFMRAHQRKAAAFYAAYPDRAKETVQNDLAVFDEAERVLEVVEPERAQLVRRSPVYVRERIAREVAARAPSRSLAPGYPPGDLGRILAAIGLGLVGLVGWLVFAPLLARRERLDPATRPGDPPLPTARLDALLANEDHPGVVQNPLTHLVAIKPGRLRMGALRTGLFVIGLLARLFYTRGQLGSIRSIHFARWVILDDRRLLFLSNYDGSWESYLGDFIDRAHFGLTGVWSHTERFPRTVALVGAGATDEEAFKRWTRGQQLLTQVWYSSYPRSSVENILAASAVREGLFAQLGEQESLKWLSRL